MWLIVDFFWCCNQRPTDSNLDASVVGAEKNNTGAAKGQHSHQLFGGVHRFLWTACSRFWVRLFQPGRGASGAVCRRDQRMLQKEGLLGFLPSAGAARSADQPEQHAGGGPHHMVAEPSNHCGQWHAQLELPGGGGGCHCHVDNEIRPPIRDLEAR